MALSDTAVRGAKAREKVYRLADSQGLCLEVKPTGSKLWRFRYRFQGKANMLSLGAYPEVGLRDARDRRDHARKLLAQGLDPSTAKKEERAQAEAQAAEEAATFEAIAREWHSRQSNVWSRDHAERILLRLEKHAFPAFGATPLAKLRAPDILPALRDIEARGHHETAKRLRQYIEAIYAYAVATGQADRNVGADLRGALTPGKVTNRPAITEPRAVGALLRAIETYEASPIVRCALRLAPLLFVRPGELRQMEWAELERDAPDGPRWVIPLAKMKMRRQDHIVPLSRQALAILEELRPLTGHGRFVFPNGRTPDRCMSDMAMNAALRGMGYDTPTEHCAHGFRAMASTMMHEMGWDSDLVELQLAHAPRNKVKAVYNRATRLLERHKLMQRWANHLDALRTGGKVVPFHQGERAVGE